MKSTMTGAMIAPCGMNCTLCRAYIREKNPCPGCRVHDSSKPKTRLYCLIKNCAKLTDGGWRYCFRCSSFPCLKLNKLDTRYRTKYGMSMIANLEEMKRSGIRNFIKREKKRWKCPDCGNLLCVHEPRCLSCGYLWR